MAAGIGLVPLAAAVLTALLGEALRGSAPDDVAVIRTGMTFTGIALVWIASYAIARRKAPLEELAMAVIAALLVLFAASYLIWAGPSIFFRADVLLWSESIFITDIIKLRAGLSIYGPPADLNSTFYAPGAQVLTHAIASAIGFPSSVPAHRAIQMVYVVGTTLLGVRAAWRVMQLSGVRTRLPAPLLAVVWAPFLFLCATNGLTNGFTHLLHNDSPALLVSMAAYTVLLEYIATRRVRWLVAAALLASAGFLVKQSHGIWAPIVGVYLVVFDSPRSYRRIAWFAAGAAAALAAAYFTCVAVFGPGFRYWTIEALGAHPVSPLRGIQHLFAAGPYVLALLLAGPLLAFASGKRGLHGAWVCALLLLAAESYTSGLGWTLSHLGPASVLAGVWFCASLPRLWPTRGEDESWSIFGARLVVAMSVVALACNTMRLVWTPLPSVTADHERYVSAIESEFRGLPTDRVLLASGSWIYLRANVIMRDRSAPAGDFGYGGVGDFSGMINRLNQHYYARILMHDYGVPEFPYDHFLWRRSSGIRAALDANYRVVRTIPAVEHGWRVPALRTVSVLEPRAVPR